MAKQLDPGAVYKGPCGALSDSPWLTAETLPLERDTIVTIESVLVRKDFTFECGGRTEKKKVHGSLKFVGKDRELGLNPTNRKTMSALFGSDTAKWFGQKIALYVDPNVRGFGGGTVCGIRIRARRIDASTPNSPALPNESVPETA